MSSLFVDLLVRVIVTVSALNFAIWYGIKKRPNLKFLQNRVGTIILLGTIVLLISLAIQIWFVVVFRLGMPLL